MTEGANDHLDSESERRPHAYTQSNHRMAGAVREAALESYLKEVCGYTYVYRLS